MNEFPEDSSDMPDLDADQRRCLHCDSVLEDDAAHCPICGEISPESEDQANPTVLDREENGVDFVDENSEVEDDRESNSKESQLVIESTMEEKQSAITSILLVAIILIFSAVAIWVLQNPNSISLALVPSATPIAPTQTLTPTWTPLPAETRPPATTPTMTPIPFPTDTPQPPQLHRVVSGETLFSLSLRYGVTLDSIAQANEIASDSGLQVSQQLAIPWPTATPPLAIVAVEVGGERIVADPADCIMYEIKSGDTFFGIAARERVPLEALMAVNRLTEQSILQPGDTICIPEIIRGGVLPPTPGPSPFPTMTEPPPGPHLLYPVREATVDAPEGPVFLQWAAVKELAEDEWYMVEVTDLSDVDSHPNRGFTRQNSFQVPSYWWPAIPEIHRYRWRVQIVQVTGDRQDGSFIYTFGGKSSEDAYFNSIGVSLTSTPDPTHTLEPVP